MGCQPGIGFQFPLPAALLETSRNSACALVYARFVEVMIKLKAAENKNPQKKFLENNMQIELTVAAMMTVFNLQHLLIIYGKG